MEEPSTSSKLTSRQRDSPGIVSLRKCMRLPIRSGAKFDNPVAFPSGRAKRAGNGTRKLIGRCLFRVPACVKTCRSRECAELFSLFSSFDGDCQSGSFLIQRNRDKLSTRKFDVGVFTQPRSTASFWPWADHFGLPPETDIATARRHVSKVPATEVI
jgi:hypothetical protein